MGIIFFKDITEDEQKALEKTCKKCAVPVATTLHWLFEGDERATTCTDGKGHQF